MRIRWTDQVSFQTGRFLSWVLISLNFRYPSSYTSLHVRLLLSPSLSGGLEATYRTPIFQPEGRPTFDSLPDLPSSVESPKCIG